MILRLVPQYIRKPQPAASEVALPQCTHQESISPAVFVLVSGPHPGPNNTAIEGPSGTRDNC